MSVKHDAEFYENASDEFIDDLVNRELESMQIDDDVSNENNYSELNNYLYESLKKNDEEHVDQKTNIYDEHDDDDDVVCDIKSDNYQIVIDCLVLNSLAFVVNFFLFLFFSLNQNGQFTRKKLIEFMKKLIMTYLKVND